VWCYRGKLADPKWKDQDLSKSLDRRHEMSARIDISILDNYTKLCTIAVDLSHLPLTPRAKPSGTGTFYRLDYEIVLLFGLTELKAVVAWKEHVRLSLFTVKITCC